MSERYHGKASDCQQPNNKKPTGSREAKVEQENYQKRSEEIYYKLGEAAAGAVDEYEKHHKAPELEKKKEAKSG